MNIPQSVNYRTNIPNSVVTRITAGAFLSCGNKVLMMKRGLHKEMAPGMWAGIGGHIDLTDINNPRAIDLTETCCREVYEETGIPKSAIKDLKLRYIAVRLIDNQVRWHHHYFGEIENEVSLQECTEGELHWVNKSEILDLPMTTSVKEAVKHWIQNPHEDAIFMVAVSPNNETAVVSML